MSEQPFVHLHLHTAYSMLDGLCRLDETMQLAMEQNMTSVAMTDHGVMYGAVEFYQCAVNHGIKPIIGCEVYITTGSRFDRGATETRGTTLHHLVLLAADNTGYHNLIQLVSAAHLEGFYYKPRIDKELLAEKSKGLIGLSACLKGEVASLLVRDRMDRAVAAAGTYADILGKDNFYLELQDHGIAEQRKINPLLLDLSQKTGLSLVATNDVHYLRQDYAEAHEVLLCLQTQTVMSDPKRMRYQTNEFYLKSRQEMEALFKDVPEALNNTVKIAERCNMEIEFGGRHFPVFDVPDGHNQTSYIEELGRNGLASHYGIEDIAHPKDDRERGIVERFNEELGVIEHTGYVNYYLVVWDFVRFARESRIPVGPGRGSGGGSLVAYVLGITAIDPLEYDLIFERFLNPERVSPPDFDIDFCQSRRGEVIEYVRNKYGRDNVAQIITFGSLGAKLVIRDVGRVLEIPYGKCDLLSKMVPDDPKMSLRLALEQSAELKQAYNTDPECTRILDYAFVLEGLYRNPGTHAAGVVIGERPLREIIPLARDKDKEVITQYAMEPLGEVGLLKMDFLGLKTLTVLHETVEILRATRGTEIDIDTLPMDDQPTYDLLNRGDTIGVFQLESGGMRDLLRRIGINNIRDLIAMVALYRPGPMNMLDDYVNRKTGRAKIKYDHPLLEPILRETYGVMVYQEQVQRAANALAGYSLGQADILRRAMGKKKAEVMEKERATFVDGCAETNKIKKPLAGRIFDNMETFAGYGFNKAHSAGYAIIAYQTAYLKANYPAEFMSALISCEMGNFDKLPVFIGEAQEMGLEIGPPSVNESGVRFRPGPAGIQFGLAGIKNVGEGAAEAIVRERDTNGPFDSLISFCARIDAQLVNKKVIESLVRCGAFDCVDTNRARLFNGIDFAMTRAASELRDKRSGQGSLFDLMEADGEALPPDELPEAEPWHESALLSGEKELLGLYLSGHPLTQYADLLNRYQLTTVEGMHALADRSLTRLGGIISLLTKRVTKTSKETMAIIQMEGLDGIAEVIVYPEAYQKYGAELQQDQAVLVCGEVQNRDEQPRLVAYEIYPLGEAPRYFATRLALHIPVASVEGNGKLEKIRDILRLHPGNVPVVICLQFASGEKVFLDTDIMFRTLPGHELVHELERELGENTVYVAVDPEPLKRPKPTRNFRRSQA